MATVVKPDAPAKQGQKSASASTATNVAQAVLFISGAVMLVLGAVIWTGEADQLIPVHELIGAVLVLALWTIAFNAARSGVAIGLVAAAAGWGLVAPILGMTQESLVEGDWHWTIQLLHLLIGIGAVVCGRVLVVSMRRAPQ